MMGYSPGFPYLTGMHKSYMLIIRVNTKNLSQLVQSFLREKCGIVTTDTYNDWLVIGYTPLKLFFPNQEDFTLFKLGDNVTFKAKEKNDIELGDFKHVNHN